VAYSRRPYRREYSGRKRQCRFCVSRDEIIDYKDMKLLQAFTDERGRIRKARRTGACRRHQSRVAQAIKRAREIALIPYTTD